MSVLAPTSHQALKKAEHPVVSVPALESLIPNLEQTAVVISTLVKVVLLVKETQGVEG